MDLGIGGLGTASEIGAGASAIVYRARQLDLDREVAVKVLSVTDEAFVRRFAREAKMLGKLSQNPGIVTVYDTGVTAAGQPYLILELCESSVLDHLQGPEQRFDPIEACQVGAQVADAVSDAHNNGVVHRDIKPGNILKSPTGRYMITDFGISTVTGATSGHTNSVGFTAGYVAPETLSGETASTPADIYALGATLFHMLSGKPAFVDSERHSNLLALAQRVINDPVPDLRQQGIPDEVCRIVEGAMAKRPQDRPTAAQLRDQLNAVVPDLAEMVTAAKSTIFGEDPVEQVQTVAQAAAVAASAPPLDTSLDFSSNPDPDATAAMRTESFGSQAAPAQTTPTAPTAPTAPPDDLTAVQPAPTGQQATFATDLDQPPIGGQTPTFNEGGILNEKTLAQPPSTPPPGEQPYSYNDDRRSLMPLLVGAVVGFLALLGAGAYLVSQSGGDGTGEDGLEIEAIEDGGTSINPSGNQSTDQQAGGGRGTLDPNAPTTETSTLDTTEATVPLVIGQTEAAAKDTLETLGFTVNVVLRENDTEPAGTVLQQMPAGNASAEQGATVSIFVATAVEVEQVTVPDLRTKTLAEAEADLASAGLVLATPVTREFHPTIPLGEVISSSPTANITVNIDSAVSLVVSDGIKPPACDSISGLTEAVATAQLEAAGFSVTTSPVSSATVADGTVTSCTESGTSSTSVNLVVSAGDICASVDGTQLAAATVALETRGFTVTTVDEPNAALPEGQVTNCTTNGATVTLTHAVTVVPPADCATAEGRTVPEARTLLTGLGFTDITTTLDSNETVPSGEVVSCTATGATATLVVSSGPSTDVAVPDVVGDRQVAGLAKIRAAGLEPEVELVDSDERAGEIVATLPAAGTVVPLDSTVKVQISNGTPATVAVPDVVGKDEADAKQALASVGLKWTVTERTLQPGDGRAGEVLRTTPTVGVQVEVGSEVELIVGKAADEDL